MKCPLMLRDWKPRPEEKVWEPFNCLLQKCAWWDEEKQACSVVVIAKELTRIQLKTGGK